MPAPADVDDVLAMQNVVGDRSIHRFPYPQALGVVNKGGGGATLAHLLELTAVLPGVGPGAVAGGIANIVVGNRRAIVGRELVLPVAVAVGVVNRLEGGAHSAGGVSVAGLAQDVAAAVVFVHIGGAIKLLFYVLLFDAICIK